MTDNAVDIKATKRKPYEPPRARDLSVPTARGDVEPLGTCLFGGQPYTVCRKGSSPTGGACRWGFSVYTQPQCQSGSHALVSCWFGGAPR